MSESKEHSENQDVFDDYLNKPDVLASLQNDSCDIRVLALQRYYKLPAVVKRRVRALKKLQFETVKLDIEFYKKLYELELEYDSKHQTLFEERKHIISGEKEPTDEECEWDLEEKELERITDALKVAAISEKSTVESTEEDVKGIPDFWFTALQNTPNLLEMIQPHDVPILKKLADVRCRLIEGEEAGFLMEFVFDENEYFSNTTLTKQYFFKYSPSEETPLEYEGPEIVRAKGCIINWKPGKNVTIRTLKKHQKSKHRHEKKTVTKTVKEDSFFNFFDPPLFDLSNELDEETEDLLEADFKIGQSMREGLIPRAVLYYTGEAFADEYDDCMEEYDSDEDDDGEESDSHQTGYKSKPTGKGDVKVGENQNPECHQQ